MTLNRFIAFVKPYLNLLAGGLAAWLVAKLNVLGIPGLGDHQNELATGLAAAGVWALTQGAAQLGDLKWLKGHHVQLAADAAVQAAALTPAPITSVPLSYEPIDLHPLAGRVEPTVHVVEEELPSDEEEFGSPPPESATTPDAP